MGFTDGRFSICARKRRKSSSHKESIASYRPVRKRQWRQHRERRFHRPQEALGRGYDRYDVLTSGEGKGPDVASVTEAADSETTVETFTEEQKLQRLAVNGMQVCAWILVVLYVLI